MTLVAFRCFHKLNCFNSSESLKLTECAEQDFRVKILENQKIK